MGAWAGVGWLTGLLAGGLAGCLTGRLVGCLAGCLDGWRQLEGRKACEQLRYLMMMMMGPHHSYISHACCGDLRTATLSLGLVFRHSHTYFKIVNDMFLRDGSRSSLQNRNCTAVVHHKYNFNRRQEQQLRSTCDRPKQGSRSWRRT